MDLTSHWKTVMNTMQDGLLVVDELGAIVALNPAAEEMTGYGQGELLGQSCEVLDCTGCKILGEGPGGRWCQLFVDGQVRAKRCTITNKEGRQVQVIKRASVLKDEGGRVIGAVETLIDVSELAKKEREITDLRRTIEGQEDGRFGLLGRSGEMQRLFYLVENVAASEAPVLIQGESGTGKELVARAIHQAGPRHDKPFIKVNCAALNQSLLESELFGHVRGAFTGAERTRVGRFEAAHGGDIFLDEIGDVPLDTQVKLLRVLENREVERVGDHRPIEVDARIITATNQDLEGLIATGEFREDLFYRINVVPLSVPPLRHRLEDVPLIANKVIRRIALKGGKPITGMTPKAMERLLAYSWPGNVRELINALELAFVLCPGGLIEAEHLPPRIAGASPSAPGRRGRPALERQRLVEVLRQCGGNQSQAARVLGVSRVTVWKRMKDYGINLRTDIV
ncbi:MAG: sigma 54-interacting transcriptional regulator [Desulfarculaceae bacterium]|nr:sigma 54-interacting transcriptional regulator [Desulfarculaceae bacterium]MCF8074448.1 sigma 54-interacting transcriptional regulator [Desulfarculaceae bacterium]MCF8102712.1 sigma 54-interacting transcriptional regulator [Desulfarculaceae bacterium]MCF8116433.1 sigma 54-interacting transcriptional regulator [Desulfarculaceae bacterium]